MNTSRMITWNLARSFRAALGAAALRFGTTKSFKRGRLFSSVITFLFLTARMKTIGVDMDDPQLKQFSARLAEMIRQVKAAVPWEPVENRPGPAPVGAVQRMMDNRADEDIKVHLRPGHQTIRQIRGRALQPPAKGAAPLGRAPSAEQTARKFFTENRALMRLADPDVELALIREERDDLGHRHLRFRQQHKDLPIWPSGVLTHFDSAGNMTSIEGAYVPTPEVDSVEPLLSSDDAVARATGGFVLDKGASVSVPELIIYGPMNGPARLAWKLEVQVSPLEAWRIVVDARDGAILHRSSLVCDGQVQGGGTDLFGASRPLNVWQRGDTFYMADTSKGSYDAAFDPIDNPHGVITIADAEGARLDDVNSSIINRAFYLLAEGLNGGLGLRKAESIFYRCLNQHLFAQSEFVDCRLGCIASAEELYGKDGTEARMTAQAFDQVEILAAPNTPDPTPLPTVSGPDSVLFVNYDFWSGGYVLGRREAAQQDNDSGSLLADRVSLARPAVTGDGTVALFVSPEFDLCAVNTADPSSRQCMGSPGLVHSVAISPDGRLGAFVLRDVQTGKADGKITLIDLAAKTAELYNLVAPNIDGASVDSVLYADAMSFTSDSSTLIYDALSEVKFGNGPTVQRWSLFALHLATKETSMVVPPQDGIDTGNPAVGRAGNRYLVYDARQVVTGASTITIRDLFTGQTAEIGTALNTWGYPSFLGDESGVVYSAPDATAIDTGYSLFKQDLTADRLHTQGDPAIWYYDANLGVVYRRGSFQGTNSLPTVILQLSADKVAAHGRVTLTATASDPDGTIARVEFYEGATRLGQAEVAPYTFVWQDIPAGNHLLTARAIDNLGGAKDSSPRFLTVSGGAGNALPTVSFSLSADTIPVQGTVTMTATAADPDGTIARVEFYEGSTKLGQSEAPPFVFVWQKVPGGIHLITARAIDNLGAETDSAARFLFATGKPNPGTNQPKVTIQALAKDTVRLTVTGPSGNYIIAMSEDMKTWTDIYPVNVDANGTGTIEDSGGPIHSTRLFYRVHRVQ